MKWMPKYFKGQVKKLIQTKKTKKFSKDTNQIWTLRFDGSKCKQGAVARIELINPKERSCYVAYYLQFFYTNNVVEYEELVRGLLMALEKDVKILVVEGDSQLVIRQIKGIYSCNNQRLKAYKKRVCDFMEDFQAFSIRSIP